jgi:hypothetical protein
MATDFLALLEDTSETVRRPDTIPTCWIYAKIGNHAFDNVRNEKATPFVRFELLRPELHEDTPDNVKQQIAAFDPPLSDRALNFDAFLSEAAKFHLTDMLDRVVGHPNLSLKVRIPQTRDTRVLCKMQAGMGSDRKTPTGFIRVDVLSVTSADAKPTV